jgi:hypothetical protein
MNLVNREGETIFPEVYYPVNERPRVVDKSKGQKG